MASCGYGSRLVEAYFSEFESLRVGLIADTHMPGTIANLWPQVHAAFDGVDCILHAGDLHVTDVIDELETIAPTFVSSGNGDVDVEHHRLKDTWTGNLAGIPVGIGHHFPTPARANSERLLKKLGRAFDTFDPRIVIYGHTHLAELHHVDERIYVNPGSATLPNNQSTRLGTLGLMELGGGRISIELYQLHDGGHERIEHLSI
ncbi:MAG: YfcE family phosphodiesterase [Pseudomonadales bacterium]|nr:YfcE family phosphodiesterase [Pseudomonadales bacterium]